LEQQVVEAHELVGNVPGVGFEPSIILDQSKVLRAFGGHEEVVYGAKSWSILAGIAQQYDDCQEFGNLWQNCLFCTKLNILLICFW
jgi:hypothetical protein